MNFTLIITDTAKENIRYLKNDSSKNKQYKAVQKALRNLGNDPNYKSLNTHPFTSKKGPNGEKIFECYTENNIPGAYRIFFYYGPGRKEITVTSIIPHP